MRVVFAGTPEFAAVSLRELLRRGVTPAAVLTQPDRPAGRGRKLVASPVKQVALDHDLSVQQPATLRDEEARAALAALRPDLMIVAAYGLLLPRSVLDVPALGCVNVHASLLPRWRGAAPIQRAIEHGDRQTGICLMQMDAGLDTGPVLARERCDIGPRETAGELHDRLAAIGATLLGESLDALATGALTAEPQPSRGVTYASRLDKNEAWIDWGDDALVIERRVRAFNPWPVTCTALAGARIRIWRAVPVSADSRGAPGTVLRADGDALHIACGTGALSLEEVQLAGGRRMTARDLVNAGRIAVGAVLDEPPDARA